jgi:hypothetical protein
MANMKNENEDLRQLRYIKQERKIRDRFLYENDNYRNYSRIYETPIEARHDLETINSEGTKEIIELKERNYKVNQYSASTWSEKTKTQHLMKLWQNDKTIVVWFVVYFTNGCIWFNLSNRFAVMTSEILAFFPIWQNDTTIAPSHEVEKWFCSLRFSQDYGDKIKLFYDCNILNANYIRAIFQVIDSTPLFFF